MTINRFLLVGFLLGSVNASAGTALVFNKIEELASNEARVSCSDISNSQAQKHLYFTLTQAGLADLHIMSINPGSSIWMSDFMGSARKLLSTQVKKQGQHLVISAEYEGAVFNEEVSIDLRNSAQGIVGTFNYDDKDGIELSGNTLKCTGRNHDFIAD